MENTEQRKARIRYWQSELNNQWRKTLRCCLFPTNFSLNLFYVKERVFISIVTCLAILSGWFVSKSTSSSIEEATQTKDLHRFQVPTVFQPDAPQPLVPHRSEQLHPIAPTFLGIYPFSKTLPIHPDRQWLGEAHNFFAQDSLTYYTGSGLQIIPAPQIQLADLPVFRYRNDKTTFFPVFLINETSTTLAVQGQNSYLFAIQEAKDSNGIWRPIETRAMPSCTTGPWARKIAPQHFAVFIMPKYAGEYETELRTRVRNGTQILVSPSYLGNINYRQFFLPKEEEFYAEVYRKWPDYFVKDCFGSIPLDLSTEIHP